jgi:hypothetical protein
MHVLVGAWDWKYQLCLDLLKTLDVKWEYTEGDQWCAFDIATASAVEAVFNNCQPLLQSVFVTARTKQETSNRYDAIRAAHMKPSSKHAEPASTAPPWYHMIIESTQFVA